MSDPSSRRLRRPAGPPPRGTSWALLALLLLPQGIAIFLLMAITPWSPDGLHRLLDGLLAAIVLGVVGFAPTIMAVRSHAWWGVCWVFGLGAVLLIAYPIALAGALAVPLGLVTAGLPRAKIVGDFGAVGLACLFPLALALGRALRMKYWQPWTRPDLWETGNEQAPRWAEAIAGSFTPELQVRGARSQAEPLDTVATTARHRPDDLKRPPERLPER